MSAYAERTMRAQCVRGSSGDDMVAAVLLTLVERVCGATSIRYVHTARARWSPPT
ncbi:hypothetical protein [Pseudonocardia phyllosphaerae]|uniref:hypothetical protein n=1 Tax=Pseudonocardia phyllosphaerae TaxID=3390502 RepID=UPI00397D3DA9